MAKLLKMMLLDLGFHVTETRGPEDALTEVEGRACEIDLVVSEFSLPEVSGSKLAAFVTQQCPSTPVILLCDDTLAERPPLPQRVTFLRKPFRREQFAALIGRLFAASRRLPLTDL